MSAQFAQVTGTITGNQLHFRCPSCSEPYAWSIDQLANIPDEAIADYCGKCGRGFRVSRPQSEGYNRSVSQPELNRASEIRNSPAVTHASPTSTAPVQKPDIIEAVKRRYADAYIVARTVDGFGLSIKVVGIVIGVIITLVSFAAGSKGGVGIVFTFIGITFAGTITTILYILGTLASAQGQILKATLDSAVNSSTFLTDRNRAEVMSLPL